MQVRINLRKLLLSLSILLAAIICLSLFETDPGAPIAIPERKPPKRIISMPFAYPVSAFIPSYTFFQENAQTVDSETKSDDNETGIDDATFLAAALLVLSEVLSFLPTKFAGIVKAGINLISSLFAKKK